MRNRWATYRFHCSSLPRLMVHGKAKDEPLGETAKSYLRELWIEETFGRKKYDSVNKFTKKGIMIESDSLELISLVNGLTVFKNKKTLKNKFLEGTPDVTIPYLLDVKSSWDIWTFFSTDYKKARADYFWQMVGYMMLTGESTAKLVYVLVTTPPEITENELYKLSFSFTEEIIDEMRKNYEFDDIAPVLRVKEFQFSMIDEYEQDVVNQCIAARKYLTSLDKGL